MSQETILDTLKDIDNKVPASPAADHTLAGSPGSARLSDGTSFYNALKATETLTGVTTVAAVTAITNPVAVTGTFWQATQPVSGSTGTITDRSSTTSATPGTSTQVAASNASRKYFLIQNVSPSGLNIWVNFTSSASTSATGASVKIPPNAAFVMEGNFISTEAINIAGEAASMAFTAKEG